MNLRELKSLVAKGESERLEFKRSTGQRTEAAKAVCAMLNGLGGVVLFGIEDKGTIVGQDVAAHTLEDVTHELRRIEPPVFPEIQTVAFEQGRAVLALFVTGGGGPYSYDGRPYLRHGTSTILMPRDEYERRLLELLHDTRRWENEPVPAGVTFDDLDAEEIQLTVENAVRTGRLEPPRSRDLDAVLRGLGLIINDQLVNAAIVLYGRSQQLQVLYPQCAIRLARFRGKSRLADFSDNRQYWGHAFELLRRGEAFLRDHVPIAGRVQPGQLVREDLPAYASRATREALANALCHRDYAIPGGAVAVAMYDDRLEITNPGAFHFGITPERLLGPHESKPWNPIIAGVFHRAGIIERWGTGTLNIVDWCRENGNPVPVWTQEAGTVAVTFGRVPLREGVELGPSRDQVGTKLGLNQDQVVILRRCLNESALLDLMNAVGRKNRTKFRTQFIKPLLDARLLEMTVPDKPSSRLQKYRTTAAGAKAISGSESDR